MEHRLLYGIKFNMAKIITFESKKKK